MGCVSGWMTLWNVFQSTGGLFRFWYDSGFDLAHNLLIQSFSWFLPCIEKHIRKTKTHKNPVQLNSKTQSWLELWSSIEI